MRVRFPLPAPDLLSVSLRRAFFISAPRSVHINHKVFQGWGYGIVSVTLSVGWLPTGAGSAVTAGAVPVESARFGLTVIMLFLVVAVDFTGRLMSVLADGVMKRGIVTLRWSVMKRNSLNNA